ncbi:DgyrCDS677 [Dimorphilus gyrociliatus]|uniref:Exocyst complex component 7 n=1 Tax=Dimorphilus gyrociliatus TaxID=2664684 RepID=A0A7I8V853_9ANNE|nr:DgyrCDS677 [Dimorphilus gyrociliatus]
MMSKASIETQLQKESNRLASLEETLIRSDAATDTMLKMLKGFDGRLERLNATIKPVHEETQRLHRRQENTLSVLGELDLILAHYKIAEEAESVVSQSPSNQIEQYLKKMNDIKSAKDYFEMIAKSEGHEKADDVVYKLTCPFDKGVSLLDEEFKYVLQRNSQPYNAKLILENLHAIASGKEPLSLAYDSKTAPLWGKVVKLPSQSVQTELGMMASWLLKLSTNTVTNTTENFAEHRVRGMRKCLDSVRNLINEEKFDLPFASPSAAKGKYADSQRRESNIFGSISSKIKNQFTTADRSPAPTKKRESYSNRENIKDDNNDGDIDFFLYMFPVVFRMTELEVALANSIFSKKTYVSYIMSTVFQGVFKTIHEEADRVNTICRKGVIRHDTSVILYVFQVLNHLRTAEPHFNNILQKLDCKKRYLDSLIHSFSETALQGLTELNDFIKSNQDRHALMPPDGTVHQMTSNIMIFLENLLINKESLLELFASKPSKEREAAHYLRNLISSLGLYLTNKSQTYTDPVLVIIFLLNNYNYMSKALQKKNSKLQFICQFDSDITQSFVQKCISYRQTYARSWDPVIQQISSDANRSFSPEKLKDRDRQLIKDKFSNFNKAFEDIYRIQKAYSVPDPELKDLLRTENQNRILPLYESFLRKYEDCGFTKNKEKYVKYRVEDIKRSMSQFFSA